MEAPRPPSEQQAQPSLPSIATMPQAARPPMPPNGHAMPNPQIKMEATHGPSPFLPGMAPSHPGVRPPPPMQQPSFRPPPGPMHAIPPPQVSTSGPHLHPNGTAHHAPPPGATQAAAPPEHHHLAQQQPQPAQHAPAGSVSPEDIQTVQNLVERCLQLYMARDEVVNVLKSQATIDPGFTQLVWSKLEEQNPEFFKCYYTRLKLKAQIVMFNHLLEQQVAVVQRMQHGWTGGAGAGPSSSTNSGIPLFQGGGANGSGSRTPVHGGGGHEHGDHHTHGGGGKDRLVPATSGDLINTGLEGHGHGALFSPLPHIGSDNDLANLGHLPTPGDLSFLPATSPLTLAPGRVPATLPRNFSLSDLGAFAQDTDQGRGARNGDETPPSFALSEPPML